MTCETVQTLVHGYIDGELDASTNQQVEAHLETCENCSHMLAGFQAIGAALRRPELYTDLPSTLIARMPRPATAPRHWTFLRQIFAFACLLILVVAGWVGGNYYRRVGALAADQTLAEEVVACHLRSLMAAHLVDVISTDKHTVKPWFDGKLDFAPPVSVIPGDDFTLAGGRLDYLDNRPVAALVYRHRKHIVNLFIWPTVNSSIPPTRPRDIRGYEVLHWWRNGMQCWAVSDTAAADLSNFAGQFIAQSN